MWNYHLTELSSGNYSVGLTDSEPHGPKQLGTRQELLDGECVEVPDVTVAPGSYVESHPQYDGTDHSIRTAIRDWSLS